MLFPLYLDKGSEGDAVSFLHGILKAKGLDPDDEIEMDRDYGDVTARAVQRLQEELGVTADGNFGPETRAALHQKTGFDVNTIPANAFTGETRAATSS